MVLKVTILLRVPSEFNAFDCLSYIALNSYRPCSATNVYCNVVSCEINILLLSLTAELSFETKIFYIPGTEFYQTKPTTQKIFFEKYAILNFFLQIHNFLPIIYRPWLNLYY